MGLAGSGSLTACMRSHSNRQYRTFCAWRVEQYGNPDRADWYLMQIAYEIRAMATHGRSYTTPLSKFRLPFESATEQPSSVTKEERVRNTKIAKAIMRARFPGIERLPGND